MSDSVNSPKHYVQAGAMLEPIDVIRFAPFDLGNAIKYVCRAGHKNDELEDFRKAEKYLDWAEEGYRLNPEFYDNFVRNHLFNLKKIKPFDCFVGVKAVGLICFLEQYIAENIERLKIERGIK